MKKPIFALFESVLFAGFLLPSPVLGAQPGDVMVPIRQFVDGFNNGDTASAYEKGNITIVDEFSPPMDRP